MSVAIAGLGWVTPLGADLGQVWTRMGAGEAPETKWLKHPETGRAHPFLATPPNAVAPLARNPRLRRSSVISQLAAVAGLNAVEHAGVTMTPEIARRTAIVFAISDGGALYTRRFYEQIVTQGANTASPLLFPETVYNAPASHLAALLGIDGASYTLVGDGAIGLTALHFAAELLETSDVEQVVVVGAEEGDWALCEAYHIWHLARAPLAEGAAAVILRREGRWQLRTHPGAPFLRQRDAGAALASVLADLRGARIDRVIASANGTFVDRAEIAALSKYFPDAPVLSLKKYIGEAPGAGALMQTVAAALTGERTLVTVVGFNQQAGAAIVSL